MSYVCKRCAIWKGEEKATFQDQRTALTHAVEFHSHRVVDALLGFPGLNMDNTLLMLLRPCKEDGT